MQILLTNDDGIQEEGLTTLYKNLTKAGHEVFVIAPYYNNSAMSHSMTINHDCKIRKHDTNIYSIEAKPVDCVLVAYNSELLHSKPELVISGINAGANLGTDIIYSATVAAARQAVLCKAKGIALSIDSQDGIYRYNALCNFIISNLQNLCSLCSQDTFLNINALSLDTYKGAKLACLSNRIYHDNAVFTYENNVLNTVKIVGEKLETQGDYTCDYKIIRQGFIAISRVYCMPSCENLQLDDYYFSIPN